jgi:hypothetical protein
MFYCEFEYINQTFRDKKIYKCSHCGTKLALEDPDAKVICFLRQNAFFDNLDNIDKPETEKIHSEYYPPNISLKEIARNKLLNKINNETVNTDSEDKNIITKTINDTLCSKEQIDERLNICSSCEHYRDNSCLLCGCVVVRDNNFNNKLAHKNANCPINKWGPIS